MLSQQWMTMHHASLLRWTKLWLTSSKQASQMWRSYLDHASRPSRPSTHQVCVCNSFLCAFVRLYIGVVTVFIGKPATSLKRGKIRLRLQLMTKRIHTRFRLVPKSVTLDDLERPLHILLLLNLWILTRFSSNKMPVDYSQSDVSCCLIMPEFHHCDHVLSRKKVGD